MSRADKKQRNRAKRENKRREARRRASISPLKRLATANGELECWISDDFEEMGQRQIFAYKRGGGLSGIACFLVDRGVVGLKDCWATMHVAQQQFAKMLEQSKERGIRMRRGTVEEARRWIAGGMRWAHQNGMCLPKDWRGPASLIGGVGDWAAADVSDFVMEFAGHPDDLRQRLMGEPFESYIRRKDVAFEFSEAAPYMDQRTGEYSDWFDGNSLDPDEAESTAADVPIEELNAMAERFNPPAVALAGKTATWLAALDEAPSVELVDAWKSVMLAAFISKAALPDAPADEIADLGLEFLEDISERIDEARVEEHDRAVGQVLRHLETDSTLMQQAVLEHGLERNADERLNDRPVA